MANEYVLKDYKGSSIATTLSGSYAIIDNTFTVGSGSSFPDGSSGPFVVVVSRGLADEEKMLIGSRTGNIFTILEKGYDGTTSLAHTAGSSVNHCLDAYTLVQANRYVNLQATKGSLVTRTASTTVTLPAGTNGYTLVADSANANGIVWQQIATAGIGAGAVTNTEVNASAAIALSKLGVLTGYVSGAGVVSATDSILQAIQKLNGNDATNANLTGMVTSVGNATTVVTNANLTGGVTSVGNVATVITNANLTGPVTSSGNATTITANAVTTTKINDDAVTAAKIADAAVTGVKVFKSISNFDGATYTVGASDWILNHGPTSSTTTVTLPNAATYEGRSLHFRNTVPALIVSATNNIVGLQSAGSPRQVSGFNLILSATDGAHCELVSNGTYWFIVSASEIN
jgi:hypothetical protein